MIKRSDIFTVPALLVVFWWVYLFNSQFDSYLTVRSLESVHIQQRLAEIERVVIQTRLEQLRRTKAVEAAESTLLKENPVLPIQHACILEADISGVILYATDSISSVLGYTSHEVIGKHISIFMNEAVSNAHKQYFDEPYEFEDGSLCDREIMALNNNGEAVEVYLTVLKYTGRSGPKYNILIKKRD